MRWGCRLAAVAAVSAAALGCSGENLPADVTRPEDPTVTLPDGADEAAPAPTAAPEATAAPAPEPEPTAAPAPEPEPTAAPAPEPEPTAAPAPPATAAPEPIEATDEDSNDQTLVIVAVLLALAVVIGLIVWSRKRSASRRHDDDEFGRQLASISSRLRWLLDQGVPSLLAATDVVAAQSTWTTANTTLNDVQQQLFTMPPERTAAANQQVADLQQAIAGMRSALDSAYQMRARHAGEPDIIAATDQAVLAQRDLLRRAIEAFETALI